MNDVPQYVRQLISAPSPMVQFSQAAAQQTARASDALGKFGADMYERDVAIQKTQAMATMKSELSRMYDNAANDPLQLDEMQRKYKEGFVSGIKSPQLAEEFSLLYDIEARSHIDKAVQVRKEMQNQEHEVAILSLIQSSIDSGAKYYDNVLSDLPEHVLGAERALGASAVTFEELLQAKNSDGTFMFTPNQRVSYKSMLEDGIRKRAEQAQLAYLKDLELQQEDYAEWADKRGIPASLSIQRQIAMGKPPEQIDVIGKTRAKQISEGIKLAENANDIVLLVQDIKAEYGDYSKNAIRKITKNLPTELTSIIMLSEKDPVAYQRQIQTMHAASKVSTEAVNMGLRNTGKDPLGISADVAKAYKNDDFTEIEQFEFRESDRAAYQLNKQEILTKFAKVYMINNPSASIEEAIAAGMAPYNDGYKIGKLNSYKFKIPTTHKAEELEKRVNEFYRFQVRKAVAEPTKQFELANNMVPVLGSDNKTYYFVDNTGEPIFVGKSPMKVTVDELTEMQMLDEKRGVLAGLPYGEREAARREMFGLDVQEVERAKEREIFADKMKSPAGAK